MCLRSKVYLKFKQWHQWVLSASWLEAQSDQEGISDKVKLRNFLQNP
jgi:hypothetical protein